MPSAACILPLLAAAMLFAATPAAAAAEGAALGATAAADRPAAGPAPAMSSTGVAAATSAAAAAAVFPAIASDRLRSERLRVRAEANRWEMAFLTLSALDTVQTCDILHRGVGVEANPLFGRTPSCAKLMAMKAGIGGVHYLMFRYLRARDPRIARLAARVSVGVQSAVVGLNMRFTFKGR